MQSAFVIVLGALVFYALGAAATTYTAPAIERELTRQVRSSLQEAGLPEDNVLVDGRDVWASPELSGDAPFERFRTALEHIEGIRQIRRRTTTTQVLTSGGAAALDIAWSDTMMTVSGVLGGETDPDSIRAGLAERFPDLRMSDTIAVEESVVTSFWEGKVPAVVDLARQALPEGSVSMKGLTLIVRGSVADENVRTETGERLAAELPGMQVINRIRLPDASAPLAAALDEIFEGRPINFEEQSDNLTAESQRLLEQAAVVLEDFPDVMVRIEGYGDEGRPSEDIAASWVKASVVRDFLVRRGARAQALLVRGMGGGVDSEEGGAESNTRRAIVRLVVELE